MVDLDIIVYPTAEVVQHFYLTSLLDRPNRNVYPSSELRQFTIDAATGTVTSRTLVDHSAELPRINYATFNTKPYRYVYANGIATQGESVFLTRSSRQTSHPAKSGNGATITTFQANLCSFPDRTRVPRTTACC